MCDKRTSELTGLKTIGLADAKRSESPDGQKNPRDGQNPRKKKLRVDTGNECLTQDTVSYTVSWVKHSPPLQCTILIR